jgi:predicted Fe-Mo cluster-binding NifX family protein
MKKAFTRPSFLQSTEHRRQGESQFNRKILMEDPMKIAVTSSGPSIDDTIDPRFGRCAYFLIIDSDTLAFESVENSNRALGGGAGIQSAQLMAEKGVSVVLTGNCGPNAFQTFSATGVRVITGVGGKVRQAVDLFNSGKLSSSSTPNVQAHFGTGRGGGGGMGRGMGGGGGMGRGMGGGGGMGRGMGGGGGMGQGSGARDGMAAQDASQFGTAPPSGKEDLSLLKEQANELRRQMEAIEAKIKGLTGQ